MPRVQISIIERLLGQPDPMLGTFRGRYTPIVPAAEDGSFVVSHVFGPARLDVTVPDGWMVKATCVTVATSRTQRSKCEAANSCLAFRSA